MKNNSIGVLIAGLAFTAGGWAMTHNNQNDLSEVAIKQKDDIQFKSTEIANLEIVVDQREFDLKAKELVIEKRNIQINKQKHESNKTKKYVANLQKKLRDTKAKLELEKKKNELIVAKKKIKQEQVELQKRVSLQPKQVKSENTIVVSRGIKSRKTINMVATSYIALCNSGCSGITATGVDVRNTPSDMIIAVDPRVIPLHTKVKVTLQNGQSFYATAEDTGGAIKGHKIDILKATSGEAVRFGRQRVTVTILD
jgi:3D (Asp-Asp-Asp) domain-containing protein